MRSSSPSRTAQAVCLFRAAEYVRPVEQRIVSDPFASQFLPLGLRAAARAQGLLPSRSRIGLATYVLARHALIDQELARSNAAQVVILGAGYDSRAWRLRDTLGERVVWEVDHPATVAAKTRYARALTAVPRRVVTVDFQRERLGTRLSAEGFDPSQPTFWIWEGVSMYLTRRAVEDTLDVLRTISAPGSTVAMDLWHYLDEPRLRSTLRRASASMLALFGEPITFGVHPTDAPYFFERLGFLVSRLATDADLRLQVPSASRWPMPECYVAVLQPES
jgi:methyltransferase (TIGR00027 family)